MTIEEIEKLIKKRFTSIKKQKEIDFEFYKINYEIKELLKEIYETYKRYNSNKTI